MTDERITAYLLQELTEREAEQFEEQCFAQTEWPAGELESAEDDLIEAYIREELTPERRRRFEENYLTTEARKDRVLLARSFMRVVCSDDCPKSWLDRLRGFWNAQWVVPKYATIAAVLILAFALFVWTWKRPAAPQTFADINLISVASARRAQDASTTPRQKISLPLGADALRISLTLPEPTPEGAAYSVRWENVAGLLKTLKIESQDDKSLKVVIPANELTPGQYTLKLMRKQGETEQRIGDYFFDVE